MFFRLGNGKVCADNTLCFCVEGCSIYFIFAIKQEEHFSFLRIRKIDAVKNTVHPCTVVDTNRERVRCCAEVFENVCDERKYFDISGYGIVTKHISIELPELTQPPTLWAFVAKEIGDRIPTNREVKRRLA